MKSIQSHHQIQIKTKRYHKMLLERYNFHKRQQRLNETVEDFANEISQLATHCLFDNQEQYLIRDHVVFGLRDKTISMSIIEKGGNPSLEEVIDICTRFGKAIKIEKAPLSSDCKRSTDKKDL